MKNTNTAAREAANSTKEKTSTMIGVTVELPAKMLKPYEAFSRKFDVPVNQVLEADVYIELEAFGDQAFANLEWIEKHAAKAGSLKSIALEFSPSVHALASKAAHLLRRTVPELIAELAVSSSGLLSQRMIEAKTDLGELQECVETLKFVREFHQRAKAGAPPIGPTGTNGWVALGLDDPTGKEAIAA